MPIKVGIPRAFLYFEYFPLWATFFQCLGAEVVTSPASNKTIVAQGCKLAVEETCLPVKVLLGHAKQLAYQVDVLFIPRVVSLKRDYYHCPKCAGLPDMVRQILDGGVEVWTITRDMTDNPRLFHKELYAIGERLGCGSKTVDQALSLAKCSLAHYQKLLQDGFSPEQALEVLKGGKLEQNNLLQPGIAIIGHAYNLYDDAINNGLLVQLEKRGVPIYTPELLSYAETEKYVAQWTDGLYWTMERKLAGACCYYARQSYIQGIILVMAFECGPNSLVMDVLAERLNKCTKPYMQLVLDEHTGEAGLVTRVEAFLDMIERWNSKHESHIRQHGKRNAGTTYYAPQSRVGGCSATANQ